MDSETFTEDSLLAVEIRDNELSELLSRLAATDAMFQSPVPTIRDVSELTEASPRLIARILGELRGPSDVEELTARLDAYEKRLTSIEQNAQYSRTPLVTPHRRTDSRIGQPYTGLPDSYDDQVYVNPVPARPISVSSEPRTSETSLGLVTLIALVFFVMFALFAMQSFRTASPPPPDRFFERLNP